MDLDLVHPLIDGLVLELPPPGSPMPWERQRLWLECAASILVLLYPVSAEARSAFDDLADQMKRSLDEADTKSTAARTDAPNEAGNGVGESLNEPAQALRDTGAGTQAPPVDTDPVAKVGEEADGTKLTASLDPASREDDDADRQQPTTSGLTGQAGEVGPKTVEASPAPLQTGKPAGSNGSAAPTLDDKLRALNAEHPEFTVQQVAAELGETFERVRNNSNAHKIKWGNEAVRAIGLQDRVGELHTKHPDWSDHEIAAAIARSNGYVRATAQRLGLVLPSRKPAGARSPAPAPEPAPERQRPPAPARAPVATIPSGSGSAVVTKPMARAPRGTRFNLRNDAGLYLHNSCETMTDNRKWAWEGNVDQLLACRKKFALARDLAEHVVEKEPARQVA